MLPPPFNLHAVACFRFLYVLGENVLLLGSNFTLYPDFKFLKALVFFFFF